MTSPFVLLPLFYALPELDSGGGTPKTSWCKAR